VSDQNKVVLLMESGTYANVSGNGYWIGQVESNSIEDSESKIETRFLGASTRSFTDQLQGPRDVKGTLVYSPQDMRIPMWAIGSVVDTSGTNSFHLATQVNNNVRQSAFTSGTLNAPLSFTIEDSKTVSSTGENFIRTINGCVPNKVTLTATQGEKVKCEVEYIGQTLAYSSGTSTSVTQSTVTPYLWNNCSLTLAGSSIVTAKEVSLVFNQNTEAPHYLNGSRDISVPFQKNRDNMLNVTLDLESSQAKMLYNDFYKTNTKFNGVFDLNADSTTGSQHAIYGLSGAYITAMENPSEVEGSVESTIEIKCPIIVGSVFDRNLKINPW